MSVRDPVTLAAAAVSATTLDEERHVIRAPTGARLFVCPHRACRGRIDLVAPDPEGVGGVFATFCSNQHPVEVELRPRPDAVVAHPAPARVQ